jgi:hypothetical protein
MKIEHWKTVDGGLALFPAVKLTVVDPPFDGAVLRVSGSVVDEASKAALKTYIEEEEPKFLSEEYLLEVTVGIQDGAGLFPTDGNNSGVDDLTAPVVLPFEKEAGTGPENKKLQTPFNPELLFGEEKRDSWLPDSVKQKKTTKQGDSQRNGKKSLGDILDSVR